LAFISTRRRRIAAEKYDDDLKIAVQDLIDYEIKIIKEEKIVSSDLVINLRHDDYKGLVYQNNGENNYITHFKI
jgi:hypothetical protein